MPSTPLSDAGPVRLRPVLRVGWVVVSAVILGLALWAWILTVPAVAANPHIPYMERVLSPILTTFLLLLTGGGGVLVAYGGFRALDRRLRSGPDR